MGSRPGVMVSIKLFFMKKPLLRALNMSLFCHSGLDPESSVNTSSGTQFEDGLGCWMKFLDKACDIFGLCRIVFVPVEQVIKAGIIVENR